MYWCEGCQHADCAKMSKDLCTALSEVTHNVVFFCNTCLQALPTALKYYDNQALVESKVTTIKKSVTEIQCSERKLCDTATRVETQFDSLRKSLESLLTEHKTSLTQKSPLQFLVLLKETHLKQPLQQAYLKTMTRLYNSPQNSFLNNMRKKGN